MKRQFECHRHVFTLNRAPLGMCANAPTSPTGCITDSDEGKLIGVLEGTGGITAQVATILAGFSKDTGARLIYDADPAHLIQALTDAHASHHYCRPSCFCDEFMAADG
ncbi:MAG: hypothetical protein OES46_02260 [Gammaproteobacteria bacterium]|nr:hypothetical protein [Gammaproteobacteria bacterium]